MITRRGLFVLLYYTLFYGSAIGATRTFNLFSSVRSASAPKVALTREKSKNHFIVDLIAKNKLQCTPVLLPVLQHFSRLQDDICQENFLRALTATDVVVVTSPQAAIDFVKMWPKVTRRDIKFASIGQKTAAILAECGIRTHFSPSQETARSLGRELPTRWGSRVLYPASAIAQSTVEDELTKRGFLVNRVNIYNTQGTQWTEDKFLKAKEIDIVTLTSPSAARAWAALAGADYDAVVIGSTTLKVAKSLGFSTVTCVSTEASSLEGLVEGIRLVLQSSKYKDDACGRFFVFSVPALQLVIEATDLLRRGGMKPLIVADISHNYSIGQDKSKELCGGQSTNILFTTVFTTL